MFDIVDVCDRLVAKLKFRHPHIYGDVKADTAEQVVENWEKLKLKRRKTATGTVLGGVPSALPAMIKASRIQEKARNVGFDWEKREEVWDKVREELGELGAGNRAWERCFGRRGVRRPFLRGDKCRKALRRES